jgi:hypothetical protein
MDLIHDHCFNSGKLYDTEHRHLFGSIHNEEKEEALKSCIDEQLRSLK